MLSLILAGSLIGCSEAQAIPAEEQLANPLSTEDQLKTDVDGAKGPMTIDLGTSGNYVILAKSQITTVPTSTITGDMGLSPSATSYIEEFSLTDFTGYDAESTQVTGKIYAADMEGINPDTLTKTSTNLTTAVSNMLAAYDDASTREHPDQLNLGAGEIGGLTLPPGLYTWGTDVSISNDVTLDGGPNDIWIFQVAKGISVANGKKVTLTGGALAKNIFWQSTEVVALGTTAHFEGIILSNTLISMNTGSSINGRLLAQTAVTLQSSTVTQPKTTE